MSACAATVTVRVGSATLAVEQISDLLGAEPTDWAHKGQPVSPTNPDGPKHDVTSWLISAREYAEDPMTPAFERQRSILVRLAEVEAFDQTRDVVLMLYGRDMGNWYTIDPEYVALIAGAGAGLILDVFNTDPEEADDPT